MRRAAFNIASVIVTLTLSFGCAASAQAASTANASPRAAAKTTAAQAGTAAGNVTAFGGGQITIQTPGKPVGVINALTSAASRITSQKLPYVWGGGHGEAGVPSIGEKGGPGYNGKRSGYDCSGAVAAVLVSAGLWPSGYGVPNDAGVIKYLRKHKLIAPGAGVGPREVTLYDWPGVHIFMNIDGRFWGTSDGGNGANAKGGPGWLDDGAYDVTRHQFRRYHFLASVLKATTSAGYSLTFDLGTALQSLPGLDVGTKVSIPYTTSKDGTMVAAAVNYNAPPTTTPAPTAPTTATASGSVTLIAPDDSSFTVLASTGQSMTFAVTPGSSVAQQLAAAQIAVNATVTVTYSTSTPPSTGSSPVTGSTLTAVSVTVNAPPPPPPSGGAPA